MIAHTADDIRCRQESAPARTASLGEVRSTIHAMAEGARWALWRWRGASDQKQLFALPDHMLKDIGLSRSNLISATLHRVREEEAIRRGYQ